MTKKLSKAEIEEIIKAFGVLAKAKLLNPKICMRCGKKFEPAYDNIAKKITGYLWKPTCQCYSKDFRLSIG